MRAAARPVSDYRVRYSTALKYAGLFTKEPEIIRGLMDANVPLALSLRAFNPYQARKQQGIDEKMLQAGYSNASLEPNVSRAGPSAEEMKQRRDQLLESAKGGGGVFGFLGDVGSGIGHFLTQDIPAAANAVYETVFSPFRAGYATETSFDKDLAEAQRNISGIPVIGQVGQVGSSVAGGIVNYAEGLYRLISGDVSDEQKKDIARGGGDPSSFGSRFSHYFHDLSEKRTPVADADVEWLKGLGKYSASDVDAAREIVTSGAMEDLARSMPALSPQAQDLILRANKDKNASDLLMAMGDVTQTSFGGRLVRATMPDAAPGEWFGPGSMSRGLAAGVAELIATWHIDPTVLAAKGFMAARAAPWTIRFNDADVIDNTVQMFKASDDAFRPKGRLAVRFDQAMDAADQIVVAQAKGVEGKIQAAKVRESWLRRYPGYDATLDTLVAYRSGAADRLRVKTLDEGAADAKEALDAGTQTRSWALEMGGDGTPLWRYTWDDGTKLNAEERARERARMANELSEFVLADAFASGRELTGSRLLMPGQVSINGKLRDAVAPVLEAFSRRDKSVLKQLDEVGTTKINLNGFVATDEAGRWDTLVSPESSQWYRNNYTFGITHMMSRAWRSFERTFSNKVIVPSHPDSTKVFGQLVSQFMPKRQAQMITAQYSASTPAERWVMTRQSIGSLLNVMNLRDTEAGKLIVERLSKGLIPAQDAIQGYRAGGLEHYTTPSNNLIKVGDLQMPAAVHPWQVAEGIQLPNWRELRHLASRNKVLDVVTRTMDGDTANALVRVWKASKVTTFSNMARQVLEGLAFTAWRDPKALQGIRTGRKAVKAAVLEGKVDTNDIKRLVGKVNQFSATDLKTLERVRSTDPEQFVNTVSALLAKNGFDAGASDVLARMASNVDVAEFFGSLKVKGPIRPGWLAAVGPYDRLRKYRAERLRTKGGTLVESSLSRKLDEDLIVGITHAAARRLGYAAESHVFNTSERGNRVNRQLVLDAAGKGIGMRPVKVSNAYEWADDGNLNPMLWAGELGRRMADPTGKTALSLMAHRFLAGRAIKARAAQTGMAIPNIDKISAAQFRKYAQSWGLDESKFTNVDDLMAYMYAEHEWGLPMRTNAGRMHYLPDGTFATSVPDRAVAAYHAGRAAVDDLVHHLGGTIDRAASGAITRIDFPDEMDHILRKVARGDMPTVEDLAKVPAGVRPEGMVAPIYAPTIPTGEGRWQGLANIVSRAYGTVVAQPLENLYLMPAFLSHRRAAYGEIEPFLESLIKRGMPEDQAAYLAETMVADRSIARIFNTSDNPMERTVFAEMSDKWLMFSRANIDFLRRLIHASVASPVGIARANVLMHAGVHTGILHNEPYQDENGNTEQRLTFTYPGSALAQRVFADAGVALGLLPEEILRVPQFNGFKSQVRFLNPGISNPTGFSVNPIFGHTVDFAEKLWPQATVDLERIKRMFSGGQDFEGVEPALSLKNLTPSMFSRFVPLMQKGDADGQFQSAMRAAMMYAEVNGQAPDANASPAEKSRFLDSVKATASNIITMRALFGMFAPATPIAADPEAIELDTLARMQGVPNLRSEFFTIREELARKYPDNFIRANSEAVAEFARRYPGELITNPAAFSIGSTKVQGVEEGYVPYTIEATRWLFENLDFVRENPTVAIALMPKSTADGDFSNEAYKLQLKFDLRTHKDLNEFYNDLVYSDDIGAYYKTRSAYFAAMRENPAVKKSLSAKLDAWEAGWERTHPLAAAELNRRSDPDFVHAEVAPSLDRIIKNIDGLPAGMNSARAGIQEMYDDYATYRKNFMGLGFYDNAGRAKTNSAYQKAGDVKWIGTPLENLWDLMRVTEGR